MGVLTISFVHSVVNLGVVYKVDTTRCPVHEDPVEILFNPHLLRTQSYAFIFHWRKACTPLENILVSPMLSRTISGQLKLHPRTTKSVWSQGRI